MRMRGIYKVVKTHSIGRRPERQKMMAWLVELVTTLQTEVMARMYSSDLEAQTISTAVRVMTSSLVVTERIRYEGEADRMNSTAASAMINTQSRVGMVSI